jgi:hypothetical protein
MCFLVAIGFENLIADMEGQETDPSPGATPSKPSALTLSIIQLVVFASVIVWSSVCLVFIHSEIRRCTEGQNDDEVGLLWEGDDSGNMYILQEHFAWL